MSRVPPPPADAVALTAFRELPDGRGRQYTESWTPGNPWQGCEHFIRMCAAVGFLAYNAPGRIYAVLDAVNEEGDIVATYDIPTARAFRFIYRKLHLRVVDTDAAQKALGRRPGPLPGEMSQATPRVLPEDLRPERVSPAGEDR